MRSERRSNFMAVNIFFFFFTSIFHEKLANFLSRQKMKIIIISKLSSKIQVYVKINKNSNSTKKVIIIFNSM